MPWTGLVARSPAARLAATDHVPDWAYVPLDPVPDPTRTVWAHRLDHDQPDPTPEHRLDFALWKYAVEHTEDVERYVGMEIRQRRRRRILDALDLRDGALR